MAFEKGEKKEIFWSLRENCIYLRIQMENASSILLFSFHHICQEEIFFSATI